MSTPDPNYPAILRRLEQVEQLLRSNPLRSASVRRGVTEWKENSTLLITDSNLQVVGEAFITGLLRVVGRIVLEGLGILTVNGQLEGSGSFNWTGPAAVEGTLDISGLTRLLSELQVDGGKITAGDVRIEDGKIYVGSSMIIDPTVDGGAVYFTNDSKLFSNASAIGLRNANSSVTIGDDITTLLSGAKAIQVTPDSIDMLGVREVTSTDGIKWLGITASNEVVKVAPGVGGPGAFLSWPLPPSTVTSEYGPREAPGEGASTFHEGLDFGADEGTPIGAAGPGFVTLAGVNGGYGNCVIIDHGNGMTTLYGHMVSTPTVSLGEFVTPGQTIGGVGNTGISFGAHLHFEVRIDGVAVNPRSKLPAV